MDLNSIKLEPTDISLLYKNSLVEIATEKPENPTENVSATSISSEFKYLGENKKQTLVVVNYNNAVQIPDKQLSFLSKLLAACNLNLGDVAIINFQNYRATDFENIINYFKPKVVLLFSIEPGDFGMPMIFPQFQVQTFKNIFFVASPSLEEIEPDKVIKSKLWVCLKKIFNL